MSTFCVGVDDGVPLAAAVCECNDLESSDNTLTLPHHAGSNDWVRATTFDFLLLLFFVLETGDLLAFLFVVGDDIDVLVPFNELILIFCVEKYGDVLVVDLAAVLRVEIEGASFIFLATNLVVWMKVGAQDIETLNSECTKMRLIVEKVNGRLHCIYLILY